MGTTSLSQSSPTPADQIWPMSHGLATSALETGFGMGSDKIFQKSPKRTPEELV